MTNIKTSILKPHEADRLAKSSLELNLGNTHALAAIYGAYVGKLQEALKTEDFDQIILLERSGNNVPRGLQLSNGWTISATQNSILHVTKDGGATNKQAGIYKRLIECGGDSGEDQKMILYLYHEDQYL